MAAPKRLSLSPRDSASNMYWPMRLRQELRILFWWRCTIGCRILRQKPRPGMQISTDPFLSAPFGDKASQCRTISCQVHMKTPAFQPGSSNCSLHSLDIRSPGNNQNNSSPCIRGSPLRIGGSNNCDIFSRNTKNMLRCLWWDSLSASLFVCLLCFCLTHALLVGLLVRTRGEVSFVCQFKSVSVSGYASGCGSESRSRSVWLVSGSACRGTLNKAPGTSLALKPRAFFQLFRTQHSSKTVFYLVAL